MGFTALLVMPTGKVAPRLEAINAKCGSQAEVAVAGARHGIQLNTLLTPEAALTTPPHACAPAAWQLAARLQRGCAPYVAAAVQHIDVVEVRHHGALAAKGEDLQ